MTDEAFARFMAALEKVAARDEAGRTRIGRLYRANPISDDQHDYARDRARLAGESYGSNR